MKNEKDNNLAHQSIAEIEQIRTAMSLRCFDLDGLIIFGIDTTGKIILTNSIACKVFGYSEKAMIGKQWTDYLAFESERDYFTRLIRSYQADKTTEKTINRTGITTNNNKLKYIEYEMVFVTEDGLPDTFLLSGKDITDFMKAQNELLLSVNRYRMLATSIPGINMYLFDTDMKFIIAEGSEMKNHGFTPAYFEGKKLQELEDSSLKELMEPLFISALAGEEITTELIFGEHIYAVSVFPLYNSEGLVYGGMCITRNITREKENAERLLKAKMEAESANNSKSEFLANVSHEIRTPLSAIVGFSEQLLKTELNSKQSGLTKIIEKSSEHLLVLVNDLLILSKIESGKVDLDENLFRVENVVKYVCQSLKAWAEDRKIGFTYTVSSDLDTLLIGDEFRLGQILNNLISNAIKFTHKGEVSIKCTKAGEDENQIMVKFEISDTGVGIPMNKQKLIFEKFRQADSAITKEYGGTGLGLSISKRLVEMQNGTIRVKSKVGEGTRFTVILPYVKEEAGDNENEMIRFEEHRIRFDGKRVLVVDDDSMIRLLSHTILVDFGFDVELAGYGAEAIEILKTESFDIVMLDIHMPGKSGLDVAKFIRQDLNDSETKILAVTAALMKKDLRNYKAAGFDNFLSKPFREGSMYNVIYKVMGYGQRAEKNHRLHNEQHTANSNRDLLDLTDLRAIAKNDDEFVNTMLETFTQNVIEGMDKITNGVISKDWKQVGEAAHKLLPSFMHLNVQKAIPILKNIETLTLHEKNTAQVPEMADELASLSERVLQRVKSEKENLKNKEHNN